MSLRAKLLAWLLAVPTSSMDAGIDESRAERTERLSVLASAIVRHSGGDLQRAAGLAVYVRLESDLSRRVADCDCPPGTCDSGKARGYTQTHRRKAWGSERWDSLCGHDSEAVDAQLSSVAWAFRGRGLRSAYAYLGGDPSHATAEWTRKRAEMADALQRRLARSIEVVP